MRVLNFIFNVKEYHAKAIYTFDPIPPENSIVSYKRPDKPRTVASYANEPSLVTFFRSLLPSFNSEVDIALRSDDEVLKKNHKNA